MAVILIFTAGCEKSLSNSNLKTHYMKNSKVQKCKKTAELIIQKKSHLKVEVDILTGCFVVFDAWRDPITPLTAQKELSVSVNSLIRPDNCIIITWPNSIVSKLKSRF